MTTILHNSDFQLVLDTMTEGILISNDHHEIILANRQAYNFLHRKKLVGSNLGKAFQHFHIWKERGINHQSTPLDQVITNINSPTNLQLAFDDGEYLQIYSVNLLPLIQKNKQAPFLVITMDDITDTTLEKMHRMQFVTMVGHELKHPLSSLKAYGYFLKKLTQGQSEKILSYLQKYDEQINLLTQMLNDLSDISKISLGQFKVELTHQDLSQLVIEIVKDFQTTHPYRTIKLSPPLELPVQIDELRIRQVLTNLLTNAVKYSEPSTNITVNLRQKGRYAIFEVQDQGIGISAAEQSQLFEPYFRSQESRKIAKGLGLGLYISQQIVRKHHGVIKVSSQLNQGTTLTVFLPLLTTSPT